MKQRNLAAALVVAALAASGVQANTPTKVQPKPPTSGGTGYTGLGADSVSAAEIQKFVAPPLDEKISRKIQAMLDVRGPGSGVITSNGERMVYVSRITGTQQVWRQDGAMKFPIQLTGGEDRTGVVGITPDDKTLVLSRDVGGQENPGLYLMSIDGGAMKLVHHAPKVQTWLEYVSDDGKALYYRANDVEASSYAIYRHDIASGKRELVFGEKGLWSLADHKGNSWLLSKAVGGMQNEVFEYDLASKKLTPLIGQGEKEAYDVSFGAKAGQVLVRTNKPSDFFRLYSLEGGKLTPVSPDLKHDVESFAIDEQRTRIYYRVNENGYQKAKVLDARTLRELALPKVPDADNTSVAGISRNGRFIQLNTDGSTQAPQNVVYDWQTGKLTTWRVPMMPEVDVATFAKATLEYYPARDGTKIPMFVRRPKTCNGPCPVVVEFHGGPEGQATAGFSPVAQLYVDAGFTFVQPNVRGSTGYGKAWLHADDGAKRLAVVTDIEDAAKHIRTAWAVGGKAPKIGVSGGSYGGYSSLMGMTYFAGAYDAGVENVGISNLLTFLQNTAPYRRILRISEYGDPEKDREALIKLSPITHISKIKAPLLVIQGVNDPRVPVGEAMQIYKELERRKIPGGMILFPDEGHGASKRVNIVATIGHTIAFFEKHLK